MREIKNRVLFRRDIRALIQLLTNEDEPIMLLGFKSNLSH